LKVFIFDYFPARAPPLRATVPCARYTYDTTCRRSCDAFVEEELAGLAADASPFRGLPITRQLFGWAMSLALSRGFRGYGTVRTYRVRERRARVKG